MVWDFMVAGGWCMAPIVFCSMLALALLLERGWFWLVLRMHRDDRLRAELLALRVEPGVAEQSKDPLCQVLLTVIRSPEDPTRATTLADRIVAETKTAIPMLNVIASVSCSLGLLGTVLGIALAFQYSSARATMTELAGALSIALNTTVLGLLVYLPVLIGVSASQMASGRLAFDLEQSINTTLSNLRAQASA